MVRRALLGACLGISSGALAALACVGTPQPEAAPPALAVVDLEARPSASTSPSTPLASTAAPSAVPATDEDGARAQGEQGELGEADDGDAGLRGSGGGGSGQGIGLGSIGTIGHGAGTGTTSGGGYGRGSGGLGKGKRTAPGTVVKEGTASVVNMSPEVIRRIVRQNIPRFRACYERALTRSPKLRGKVIVRFVIRQDGSVSQVSDTGSTMPDAKVKACVLAGFRRLSFPAPSEGRVVTVTYPLVFEAADLPPAEQPTAGSPPAGAGAQPSAAAPSAPTSASAP